MTFSNADPKHADINPLRARRDKPHIWFEEGYWRACPMPTRKNSNIAKSQRVRVLWRKAYNAISVANEAQA